MLHYSHLEFTGLWCRIADDVCSVNATVAPPEVQASTSPTLHPSTILRRTLLFTFSAKNTAWVSGGRAERTTVEDDEEEEAAARVPQ